MVEDGLAVSADRCVVSAVDAGWGVVADAGVAVVVVVVVEKLVGERSGVGQAGESLRESWVVFRVLNWASENGLSLDTCGLEWEPVTPRSARSWGTVREVIDVPRSAWRVSWPGSMRSA
jgi:hypothetical protein